MHIGTLQKLQEVGITFDVWAVSCIGAWVGIVYQQFKGNQAQQTYDFFKNHVFRDGPIRDFRTNAVFGDFQDWTTNMRAMNEFLFDLRNYQNLVLPNRMMDAMKETMAFFFDPNGMKEISTTGSSTRDGGKSLHALADIDDVSIEHCQAPHSCALPESSFLKALNFDALDRTKHPNKPFMFFNASNLNKQKLRTVLQ